ncbi:STAS domain-containing protein [Quadrisphaera sp. KR29]|uniref:STAS domain-containing protein n=1 Tax=Quadrisphaera sp. KR29 TaxID=3461391 RepID=UPI004044B838
MALTVLRPGTTAPAGPPAPPAPPAPGAAAAGALAPPGRSPLRVAVEVHQRAAGAGALVVMTLTGDLDASAGPHLRSALEQALLRTWSPRRPQDDAAAGASAAAVAPDVVVDLAAVPTADAAGGGLLLATLRRTTALGGRAAVVGADPAVERLLAAADTAGEVAARATLAEALSAWKAATPRAGTGPLATGSGARPGRQARSATA